MSRKGPHRAFSAAAVVSSLLVAAALSACGSSPKSTNASTSGTKSSSTTATTTGSKALTKVTFDGPTQSEPLFLVAQDLGYFRQAGLTGTYTQLSTTLNNDSVLSGKIDYTFNVGPTIDSTIFAGEPLRALANFIEKTTIVLVGRPGITTLAQLRGKTIADPGPTTPHRVFTEQLLQQQGGGLESSVKFLSVPGANSTAEIALLEAGKVQAATMAYPYYLGLPANYSIIYNYASTSSPFVNLGNGLAARLDYAQSHSKQTQDIISALTKAAHYLATNEAGSLTYYEKVFKLDAAGAKKMFAEQAPTYTQSPIPTSTVISKTLALDKIGNPKMASVTLQKYQADYLDLTYAQAAAAATAG